MLMKSLRMTHMDLALVLLLFSLGYAGSYLGSGMLGYDQIRGNNVWFNADSGRVYRNMTDKDSSHYRSKVHPAFSLVSNPVVAGMTALGLEQTTAVRVYFAFFTGVWLLLVFAILRSLSLPPWEAGIFSVLAGVTASGVFWSVVPETFMLGGISMLLALWVLALAQTRRQSLFNYVLVNAISFSMTVTNWMAGILTAFAQHNIKKTIIICGMGLCLATLFWAIQNFLFPSSVFFLSASEEANFIFMDVAGGMAEKSKVFFVHSIVIPVLTVVDNPYNSNLPFVTIQFAPLGSNGLLTWLATAMWLGLLGFGLYCAWRENRYRNFALVLLALLAAQFVLHSIYGDETFLYSLHWVSFMVLACAFGARSEYRQWVLGAVLVLIPLLGFNNLSQFYKVVAGLQAW